jgi:hypothetical protein
MSRITTTYKALKELGPQQVGLYTWYQFGLRSGYLKWATASAFRKSQTHPENLTFCSILDLPGQDKLISLLGESGMAGLFNDADQIAAGDVRVFGAESVPLQLSIQEPLQPWTMYEIHPEFLDKIIGKGGDIKYLWEPARFGWAFTLARAYYLSGNERYSKAFWEYCQGFLENNPPYQGPFWTSAQEVALRLIALVFSLQVFWDASETSPGRKGMLLEAVSAHAARIPATIAYSRAQKNNHLLSEAAGLITAGTALPDHPQAEKWKKIGWHLVNSGFTEQIGEDGSYIQHSANYHRLMLQTGLWVKRLSKAAPDPRYGLSQENLRKLGLATRWLGTLLDRKSGTAPNLGPNDGSYILPLAICPFEDYRPVLQAACCSFLGVRALPPGQWDELDLWIGDNTPAFSKTKGDLSSIAISSVRPPHVLQIQAYDSWAYMRVAQFNARPGHSDQLHVDIWWQGLNIAQDAGTYLYNAPPPWDNALSSTDVHNTLTVNNCDQMNRAGRFLYLDWAQSHLLKHERDRAGEWERVTAQHVGYNRLGVTHRRTMTARNDGIWHIEDSVFSSDQNLEKKNAPFSVDLQWLLPDWPWEVMEFEQGQPPKNHENPSDSELNGVSGNRLKFGLNLLSPEGRIQLTVSSNGKGVPLAVQIVRAGKLVYGNGEVSPTWGWISPTYGQKNPGLSLRVKQVKDLPINFTSLWTLPELED